MIDKLDLMQIFSGIIQLAYIIYLIRKENFIHDDFGPANIGIRRVSNKYVKIMSHKIPTYGLIFVALDYGKILSLDFNLTIKEKKLVGSNRTDTFGIKFMLMHDYYTKGNGVNFDNFKTLVPKEDIKFIMDNLNNLKIIINYLFNKYFKL